jgi:hypothetical protein
VHVCESLETVRLGEYDVAHVHHNVCAYEVRYHFPELPMVFVSHGVLPFLEAPPAVDLGIARYLAVSEEVRDRLVGEGIAPRAITVFRNVVDEDRFAPGPPLPGRPTRAVVLSNKIDTATEAVIREACGAAGIEVLFLGSRFVPVDARDLPAVLREAHLVFTLGRGAMEAMLCGRVPFILDYQGGDGMVTPDNALDLLACNLSGRRHRRTYTPESLLRELDAWDPALGPALRDLARRELGTATRIPQLEALYREVLASRRRPRIGDEVVRVLTHLVGAVGETRAWADHLSRSAPAEPDRAGGRTRLASALLRAGWLESAREMLSAQLAADPDHLDSLALLARIGLEDGNHEDALAILRHVLTVHPAHPIATEALAALRGDVGATD